MAKSKSIPKPLTMTPEQHRVIERALEAGDRMKAFAVECHSNKLDILAEPFLDMARLIPDFVTAQYRPFREGSLTSPAKEVIDKEQPGDLFK